MNWKQLLKNAASNYGRMFVGIGSTLLVTPAVVHGLGPENFGIWALTSTIASYFNLLDFGITSATIRYISHFRALGDVQELNKTASTSFCWYAVMAVLSIAGGGALAYLSPRFFHAPDLSYEMHGVVFNIGIVAAIGFLSVVPTQCVIAAQRQDILNRWMLISQILGSIATFIGVTQGKGVFFLAALQTISSLTNAVIALYLMKTLCPEIKLRWEWDARSSHKLVNFASWAFVTSIAWKFVYSTDSIIIGRCISISAITGFALAQKLVDSMRALINAGAGVLGTFVSEQAALGNTAALKTIWFQGSKWSLSVSLPVCLACCLIPDELFNAWLGNSYNQIELTLGVLAITALIDLSQSSAYQILLNAGLHKQLGITSITEGLINLILSVSLVQTMGIAGVAIGTLIPCAVRCCIVYPLLLRRLLQINPISYPQEAIIPGIVTSTPPILLILAYKYLHWHSGRLSLLALILACSLTLIISAWFAALSIEQRRIIRSKCKSKLRAIQTPICKKPIERSM